MQQIYNGIAKILLRFFSINFYQPPLILNLKAKVDSKCIFFDY